MHTNADTARVVVAVPADTRPSPATTIVVAATGVVALTAFVLAYGGSRGAAVDAGMSNRAAAWYPLCIEGALCVASAATVVLGGRYPWLVLTAFTALSSVANILHALDHPGHHLWAPAVAAVPPVALPICVELAMRVGRRVRPHELTPSNQRVLLEPQLPVPTELGPSALEPSAKPAPTPVARDGGESGRLTLVGARPVPREFPAACHCTTAGCDGQMRSKATWHRHNPRKAVG